MKDTKTPNNYQLYNNLDWKFEVGDKVRIKDNLKYGDILNGMMIDDNILNKKGKNLVVRQLLEANTDDLTLYYVTDENDNTPYSYCNPYRSRLYVADMLDKVEDIISKDDYYNDIIDCIQYTVNNIVNAKYSHDPCQPQFLVSILHENEDSQKIILNCTHLGKSFSRVLFPRKDRFYGYDNLGDVVESLYNQTM